MILAPDADDVAACVARRLPDLEVLRWSTVSDNDLAHVTFCCMPYMNAGAAAAKLAAMPALRVVQSLSSGVDDLVPFVPDGVTLCNGRGLHHEEGTAELAVTLMLAWLRRLPAAVDNQRQQRWEHVRTDTLDGKTVLLVGYGGIGHAIEQRLQPFGANVIRVSRTARPNVAALNELATSASGADILVICIALTPETRNLIDKTVLRALPDGALVVNVARGPVVDGAALLTELQTGRINAALDVIHTEPLPADAPEWRLPNVLITPHIGGDTTTFARRAGEFVADQAARHVTGEPLHNVVASATSSASTS